MSDSDNPEVGKFIDAGGMLTNVHDVGSGPPLFLLHGSGPGVTGMANWRLTIPALSNSFRVVVPDLVGFGFTKPHAGIKYNMDTWVDHLSSLMDALGIDKADFVGNSFGGGVALALAIRQPDRVRRMVLMGSAGLDFEMTEGLDFVWGYTPSIENMRTMMGYFAYDQDLISDELVHARYDASRRPGTQEMYEKLFPAPRRRWIQALSSPEDAIRSLSHKVLIVHGREDKVVPSAVSHQLHGLISDSQLHMFGRCGHWTQIEHKDSFNALASSFFSS